jgi:hypothetical protein
MGKTARSQSFQERFRIESQQRLAVCVNGPRFLSAGPLIMGDNRIRGAARALAWAAAGANEAIRAKVAPCHNHSLARARSPTAIANHFQAGCLNGFICDTAASTLCSRCAITAFFACRLTCECEIS